MIGREADLGALRAAFASGANGAPHVALISGEAGIGKTRLVTEFLNEISLSPRDPAVVVATGQCVDLGDIGAPFSPVRRMLRQLYLEVGDQQFREAAGTALVIRTLGALVPDLAPEADTRPDIAPEFVTEAIELVIAELGRTRHLVIVFEDLHWADPATLALLKDLSITLRGGHVTILMTYRTDDVGRRHALRPVLTDLERNRAVSVVPLARLGLEDAAVLAAALRAGLRAEQARIVAARSEGVPFLVEELVELDAGAPLPGTLRDVVLARYERLSPLAAKVVATLAVGGVRVDEDLLADVYDGEPSELRAALREATDASVLVADRDGYRFRHALIREAVHDDLFPRERIDLHNRYADALEQRVSAGRREDAAELAEHRLLAHDIPKAFDATLIARQHAEETLAPIAAASLGERLLDLWPQIADAAERVGLSRAALSLEVAQAYEDGGERDKAMRAAEAGIKHAVPDENLVRVALMSELGDRLLTSGRRLEASEVLRTAHDLLDPDGPAEERALLARIDAVRVMVDPRLEPTAVDIIDRAVALAESAGEPAALGMALLQRAGWHGDRGELVTAETDLRRAADLPADIRTHLQAMVNLTGFHLMVGHYQDAVEAGRRAIGEAVLAGQERGLGAFLTLNVGEAEIALGEFGSGLAMVERAGSALPTSHYFQSCVLTLLATSTLWNDEVDRSRSYRAREASMAIDGNVERLCFRVQSGGYAALAEAAPRGAVADAEGLAERTKTVLEYEQPGMTDCILPMSGWLAASDRRARSILFPTLDRALALPDPGPQSAAFKAVSRAFLADDVTAWREGLAQAEEGRIPNRYVHLARFRLGKALLATGEREEASAQLDRVSSEAPAKGASLIARWARMLTAIASSQILDTAASPALSSLSTRELQVLGLVAEGLTNPQIGRRLYISPKTVSVHVSAVLAKIGAANRAEAAAIYTAASAPSFIR
jgi:DNA-binding CsgD family transcriptional regulator